MWLLCDGCGAISDLSCKVEGTPCVAESGTTVISATIISDCGTVSTILEDGMEQFQ